MTKSADHFNYFFSGFSSNSSKKKNTNKTQKNNEKETIGIFYLKDVYNSENSYFHTLTNPILIYLKRRLTKRFLLQRKMCATIPSQRNDSSALKEKKNRETERAWKQIHRTKETYNMNGSLRFHYKFLNNLIGTSSFY